MGVLSFNLSQLRKDAKTIEQITRGIDKQAQLTSRTFIDLGRDIDRALGKTTSQYRQHYRDVDRVTREGSRGRVRVIKEGYTQELKDLREHSKQIEAEAKNIQNRLNKAVGGTPGKPLGVGTKDQQYDNLIKSLNYRADWFVSGAIFYGSIRASRKLLDIIADTEMGMINLQKVMQGHATDYDKLQKDLMNLGQAYGYLNKEVLDVSTIWAQAGMRQGEIEELTRVTLLNMNVGMMNAEESARYLLATLKQFNMEVKDSITIVDMVNEVANNYAVTNKDLMEAMAITGSVARNVGLTMGELIGHITALSESTARSGNEIGNALKTIYSYVYRPGTINVFENLGIQVRDGADGFRDLNFILKDVQAVWRDMTEQQQTEMVVSLEETAEAWQTLSEAEQMELSMSAAGVRRRNFFISLVESMTTALEATERAHYSLGSAEKENEKYLESYRKRVEQLQASVQELAVAMGESGLLEVLKENVMSMKILVDWYNELPEPITNVTNKMVLLTGAILMLNVAARVFVGEGLFSFLIKRTTALATAAAGAEVATHTLGQSLGFLAKAPIAVMGQMGATIAVVAAFIGIVVKARKEYVKQQEEMKKTLGVVGDIKEEYQELQQQTAELQREYENLSGQLKELYEGTGEYAKAMGGVNEITEELNKTKAEEQSINNKIAEMLPTVVLEYDKLGNAVRIAWGEVANLIDKHKELAALSEHLPGRMTVDEAYSRIWSMETYPESHKRLYRKEYQELARADLGGMAYVPEIYRRGIEVSPGIFQHLSEEQYAQWRFTQEKNKLIAATTRTGGKKDPTTPGGGFTPTGGGGGTTQTIAQLLQQEMQQLQFYLESTKVPAVALGRDLDVLGQTFEELTEDIKVNGLTLADINSLYAFSTKRAELLHQKQKALQVSSQAHQAELEGITQQIKAMVPGYTDASFTADDLRQAMDRMSADGRDALKILINEHNKLTGEIHNTAMEMRNLEREAGMTYGTIESLIKDRLANTYRLQEQLSISSLKRTQEAEERSLQERMDNYDLYMQKRIDAIQTEIDAIDELMRKYREEDRDKDYRDQVADIEDEIAAIKKDKRFEFITEIGERILTYDVARVKELEEQKMKVEEEYSRYRRDQALEADKRKLEDSKRSLEDERKDRLDAFKKEQQDLREHHNKQMESLRYYWQERQVQEQVHRAAMRLIEEEGYEEALFLQNKYFTDAETAYRFHQQEMQRIGVSIAQQYSGKSGGGGSSSGGGSSGSSPLSVDEWGMVYNKAREQGDWKTMETANREANKARGLGDVVTANVDIEYIKSKGGSYHAGGIAGAEGLAWIKRDEVLMPKEVFANLPIATKSYGFSRAMGTTMNNQYGAVHITVQADDWQQFMRSIPPAIRARIGGA